MAFIIGAYNKYDFWDRTHSIYKFKINNNWYAIKEIQLEWGLPQLGLRVNENEMPESYHIYDTYEDALKFARKMKTIN